MFWGPNTVFKRKSGPAEGGSQVQISQLVGKNIIVLFEDYWLKLYPLPMKMLGERYMQMKVDIIFARVIIYICVCDELNNVFYEKNNEAMQPHGTGCSRIQGTRSRS
ncbi:hypothetical protein POM88_002416 [Heracleum sosnowskyi]|uniref:Uncharacterized protein n=1 Tax=Heracleum sosnowskyi TaxID=360622 RepID=A0AAD8NBT6_9APIA|nr:hypothetical protein POM88_002416 [Heracleum sosnowskyi]